VNLRCVVLADEPSLEEAMWAMPSSWPEFMLHDPIGNGYYAALDLFAEHVLVCFDETGDVVAKAFSVPFHLDGGDLPADGWDGVVRRGLAGRLPGGREPNAVSAVEIAVRPDMQGHGLSSQVLAALRDNARRLGYAELVAPVRPSGKTDPHQPMTEHAAAVRADGLPADPWLRVHVRAGGRIDQVASRSMVIPGTLEEWRAWTGLAFDRTCPVEVPGALTPVYCDVENGTAVYVEPNVWVRHRTGA